MAHWDIFHAGRLEVERGLSTEAVRLAIASGAIREDDLARPAGSSEPWVRVGDSAGLIAPPPDAPSAGQSAEDGGGPPSDSGGDDDLIELHLSGERPAAAPGPPPTPDLPADWAGPGFAFDEDDEPAAERQRDDDEPPEVLDESDLVADDESTVELGRPPSGPAGDDRDELVAAAGGSMPPPGLTDPGAPPVVEDDASAFPSLDVPEAFDPLDEDEEAAAFTLAADPAAEPDEIDLTAMVDVAFQLVLFFLVTATTLYFKTLEIPTPEPEDPDAVAQQMRTLDELLEEYILVEIDPRGAVQVDREPIAIDALADRLRQIRSDTLRTGMLLMADFATPHRNAVRAIDSANAIGLQIAIARPSAPAE